MARRSYGTGSIVAAGAGRWKLTVSVGIDPVTGKRRRVVRNITGSKSEAQRALLALQAELAERRVDRSSVTLGQTIDAYFEARPTVSSTSVAESRRAIDRYVPDHLRRLPLRRLGAFELDRLYRHLETAGGVCRRRTKCTTPTCEHGKGAPLAASTVIRLHHDIHAALEQAVRWQWIRSNPADLVRLSDVVEDQVDVDPEEVVRLLAHLAGIERDTPADGGRRHGGDGRLLPRGPADPSPLPAFVDVLLATGARVGEVCALTYGQLDLDRVIDGDPRPQIKIDASRPRSATETRKPTKTNRTRRPVLDAYTSDVLRRRRADWMAAALAAGVPLEQLHVFPSRRDIRKPIRPDVINTMFAAARADAGVSTHVTLRNLRHLVASLLAEAGVHPTTIAGRLGHSAVMLLNRYAHVLDTGNAAAADIVNRRLGRTTG